MGAFIKIIFLLTLGLASCATPSTGTLEGELTDCKKLNKDMTNRCNALYDTCFDIQEECEALRKPTRQHY